MKVFNMALATIAMIAALAAPNASAHLSNPDFHSEIEPLSQTGVTEGVVISIAPGSDHVRLENDSGKTVTVIGTEGEPYIRILANGDVQVNENSVTYMNDQAEEAKEEAEEAGGGDHEHSGAGEDHGHADGTEPHGHGDDVAGAGAIATGESGNSGPDWQTVGDVEKGAYEWRDSRVRYLGEGVPPQVTDQSKETLVDNYVVPLEISGQTVEAKGTLTWKGDEEGSSTLPFIGLGLLAVVAVIGAGFIHRRRKDGTAGEDEDPSADG